MTNPETLFEVNVDDRLATIDIAQSTRVKRDTFGGFTVAQGRTVNSKMELGVANASATAPVGAKPVIVAECYGPGVLKQVWMAAQGADLSRSSVVEDGMKVSIFLDNSTVPVASMPINDFFCYGARGDIFANNRVGRTARMGPQSSAYRNMYAPFSGYMRVELENTTAVNATAVYANVEYESLQKGVDVFRSWGASSYKNLSTPAYSKQTVCDSDGAGQIESIYVAMDSTATDEFGFLEGNIEIYVDGETSPSFVSSGMEDFFCGGWYQMPVGGYPSGRAGTSDLAGTHSAMYRFFTSDPIRFNTHVKVVVPVGQRGQGSITTPNLALSSVVTYWLDAPRSVTALKVDKAHPIVKDSLSYTGPLSPAVWNQIGDRTQAVGTGSSITFPYTSATTGQDARIARKGLTIPANYFAETKMRITDTHDGMDAGLVASGSEPDPFYGSAVHVHLTRVSQYVWQVKARDDFDTPFVVDIGNGADLTNKWIWLGVKVVGTKRTAYYKFDGALDWTPLGSWTSAKSGKAVGLYSWQTGCEFKEFNVYPLA